MIRLRNVIVVLAVLAVTPVVDAEDGKRLFGFASVDITPSSPLRLSGYGSRDKPFEGVDTPLHARAMAIREADSRTLVLVAVDTIGFTAVLTNEIHRRVEAKHGIPRSGFVICGTHTHNAPHLSSGLANLFSVALTEKEQTDAVTYTDQVRDAVVEAVDDAIADLAPGTIQFSEGEVGFAANRRVVREGAWSGFGITPRGQVDHALPLLRVTDESGKKLRGLVFNYACHCTSLGSLNRVNGDWAGYASTELESKYPGVVALCCIGCGADANPPRTNEAEKAISYAKASAAEIVDEVTALVDEPMEDLAPATSSTFGFAGLPSKHPTDAEQQEALKSTRPQVRRHAEKMLDIKARKGRLPATYPMPIQVWRFGDSLTMVFLGGEVVADYSLRIKEELPGNVWVSAYSNDVFAYVASEEMQSEGGYEVDSSMIYYGQPGRWRSGTEDLIIKRVHELFENANPSEPLSLDDALDTFTVPKGFVVDVVAAEPLIRDPVSFAVGPDSRLWVAEMGDYPRGPDDVGLPGRIRVLTDVDRDGRYDEGTTFLDDLAFPTGVFPWGDGAIVVASPDLLYASDANHDGVAEKTEVLWTGFNTVNAQHLVNGFSYGLDHKLYLSGGTRHPEVQNPSSGAKLDIARRDVRLDPRTGSLEPLSGQSQYGRTRDDWGHWFGNSNSEPLHHYVIEDADLARNPFVPSPSSRIPLANPPLAPPVFPTSRTVDRFNDLSSANRFTSACSPLILRDGNTGEQDSLSAFICEPVHNLVSRLVLSRDGVSFKSARHPDELESEFFASSDPWCRPVYLQTGADGCLWIADMYRSVIEHPEWIPDAWQSSLDLYAGNRVGRIYRVRPREMSASAPVDLIEQTSAELVESLSSGNGWVRDTSQQLLIERDDDAVLDDLHLVVQHGDSAAGRLHALWTLHNLGRLTNADLDAALAADHPGLICAGLEIGRTHDPTGELWLRPELARHENVEVRYQLALAAGDCGDDDRRRSILSEIAIQDAVDRWVRAAIVSSAVGCASDLLEHSLLNRSATPTNSSLIPDLIATTLADQISDGAAALVQLIAAGASDDRWEGWRLNALADVVDGLRARRQSIAQVVEDSGPERESLQASCQVAWRSAREIVESSAEPLADRVAAVRLLGRGLKGAAQDNEMLARLLGHQSPRELQSAAIDALIATSQPGRLLAAFPTLTPDVQRETLTAVLTRGNGLETLLDSLESGIVEPNQLDAATRDYLLHYPSYRIQDRAAAIFGRGAGDRQQVIDEFVSALHLSGNPTSGRQHFEKRCGTCHQHAGIGKAIGPQLGALRNKPPSYFLDAILDPNRAVEAKYRAYTVVTTDGRVLSGMVVDESATAITLALTDGKSISVLRNQIEELNAGRSFMPEGFEKDLSQQDIADILAFLSEDATTSQ